MEASQFTCSICGEGSQEICVYCTKDACGNHLCGRCGRCSDCCTCASRLDEAETAVSADGHLSDGQSRSLEL